MPQLNYYLHVGFKWKNSSKLLFQYAFSFTLSKRGNKTQMEPYGHLKRFSRPFIISLRLDRAVVLSAFCRDTISPQWAINGFREVKGSPPVHLLSESILSYPDQELVEQHLRKGSGNSGQNSKSMTTSGPQKEVNVQLNGVTIKYNCGYSV